MTDVMSSEAGADLAGKVTMGDDFSYIWTSTLITGWLLY